MSPYLNLIGEALPDTQSLVWIPQDDLEALLQAQLPPDPGQAPVSPGCQSQRGDAQQHHVPMVGGTLLGGGEQRLDDLQSLHGRVFVEVVRAAGLAGRSDQSDAVVLDQNSRPDHGAVQLGEPGTQTSCYCLEMIQICK